MNASTSKRRSGESWSKRKPGKSWDLWRVVGRDRAVGYLVTHPDRHPKPVAFVFGTGAGSFRLAMDIRNDHSRATEARDLRPIRGRRFCRALIGWLLLPIDRRGRVIANDRTFAAGMYTLIEPRNGRPRVGFALYTHCGLRCIQEERDTPEQPHTPKLASRTGEKAGMQTAA